MSRKPHGKMSPELQQVVDAHMKGMATRAREALGAALQSSNMTQSEVAAKLGVKRQALNPAFTGRSVPGMGTLSRIAAAMGHRVNFTIEPESPVITEENVVEFVPVAQSAEIGLLDGTWSKGEEPENVA